MSKYNPDRAESLARTGILGTIVTAILAFTPIPAILLNAMGAPGLTPWLPYLFWPLLAVFAATALYGLYRWRWP